MKRNSLTSLSMNYKVSVIVPVYNVETYLRSCLNSILMQTFENFEAILVDDGSTDGSSAICDEYAVKDERIKVVHKENGGVSSARNVALDCAEGEWIFFCDADDMLFDNSLESMLKNVEGGIDSVCCGYVKISETNELISTDTNKYNKLVSTSEALIDFYQPLFSKAKNIYLWNRLFKNSVIQDNKLRFRKDLSIKEDGLFIIQYLCKCKDKHKLSSIPVYKYRLNLNSVMNTYGQSLNSKTISGLYAGMECSEEIQRSSNNKLAINLSREFVVKRFLYLLLNSIKARKLVIGDVIPVARDVLMFVSAKDVINVFVKLLRKRRDE